MSLFGTEGGGFDMNSLLAQAQAMQAQMQSGQMQPGQMPGMAPAQPAAAPDPVEQLEKLAALKEKGALTEAEFEAEKAKILGQ